MALQQGPSSLIRLHLLLYCLHFVCADSCATCRRAGMRLLRRGLVWPTILRGRQMKSDCQTLDEPFTCSSRLCPWGARVGSHCFEHFQGHFSQVLGGCVAPAAPAGSPREAAPSAERGAHSQLDGAKVPPPHTQFPGTCSLVGAGVCGVLC